MPNNLENIDINLTLRSEIKRLDEFESYDLNEPATLTITDNGDYIRYIEHAPENAQMPDAKAKVMLKLQADGTVKMRRTGILNTQLHFDLGHETTTNYRTPAGNIVLTVKTTTLKIQQNADKTVGDVLIGYDLIENDSELGHYQIAVNYQKA